MKPPFRWVGGKRRFVKDIALHFPRRMKTYAEPFAGSAAVMLELIDQGRLEPGAKIWLNDLSPVVDFWACVAHSGPVLDDMLGCLAGYHMIDPAQAFEIARQVCDAPTASERAAAFLVLNQLSFNGLFRRNRKGQFNVPRDRSKTLKDRERDLLDLAHVLADFDLQIGPVPGADRCKNYYMDPPYDGKTFTAYGAQPFGVDEQGLLAEACEQLVESGARVVASNADTPRVREFYRGFTFYELKRGNQLSAKASTRKEQRGELLMVR